MFPTKSNPRSSSTFKIQSFHLYFAWFDPQSKKKVDSFPSWFTSRWLKSFTFLHLQAPLHLPHLPHPMPLSSSPPTIAVEAQFLPDSPKMLTFTAQSNNNSIKIWKIWDGASPPTTEKTGKVSRYLCWRSWSPFSGDLLLLARATGGSSVAWRSVGPPMSDTWRTWLSIGSTASWACPLSSSLRFPGELLAPGTNIVESIFPIFDSSN